MVISTGFVSGCATKDVSGAAEAAIEGGREVQACGWPTAVGLVRSNEVWCTGTLVHPQLVVFSAGCTSEEGAGRSFDQILIGDGFDPNTGAPRGRLITPEFCKADPSYRYLDYGKSGAFCKLSQPITDVAITPPLMGCETSLLKPGAPVTIVGFGSYKFDWTPIKTVGETQLGHLHGSDGAYAAESGTMYQSYSDVGGPGYIQVADGSWRTWGVAEFDPGPDSNYALLHVLVPWIERESGIDITPCHDADGTWNPGPSCKGFALDPGASHGGSGASCKVGPVSGYSATCGAPYQP
jgi:hypothetical protein